MDFTDYVADLEGEVRALRDRITELEEQLRVACERKVEETDEGVLPEEIDDLNHLKKEETIGLDTGAVKHQVGQKRSKLVRDTESPVLLGGESAVQPLQGSSPTFPQEDGDVIIVGPSQQSQAKRKRGIYQPNPRPSKKLQMCWVEIPPRKKHPAPARSKPPSTDEATTAPVVKDEPDQEMINALAVIGNSSTKPDKKALDDVSVYTRLSKIGLETFPITIEEEIKDFAVGRIFLSQHFGGSPVGTFPTTKEERILQHGFDNLMYANTTLHPYAPSTPGAPGIWIHCNNGMFSGQDVRLIVRVKAKPLALWQYMGQYDAQPSDPLSLQEWTMQSEQTKVAWVKCMYERDWGGNVRARIKLRKFEGRKAIEGEEGRLGVPDPEEVTPAEIRQAFDTGEELYTWTLKGRGYDERFQREIWDAASTRVKGEEKSMENILLQISEKIPD